MSFQYAKDAPEGFTNAIKNVAIVGAGGQLGRNIAEALLNTGKHAVTAITRKGSSSTLSGGVRKVAVDYASEDELAAALEGQDFFIITLALAAAPGTHTALVKAAARAGVKYVMPNAYGVNLDTRGDVIAKDIPVAEVVLRNIAEVRQSGLTSVAMMNGFWYEYSLVSGAETFGFDLDGRAVTMYDDGNKDVNVSTWAHCARAVAALLSLKVVPEDEQDASTTLSAFANKTVLVSSFRVSQRDILSSVQRVTGTTDADWSIRYQPSGERHREGVAELEQGIGQGFFKMLYARIFYPSGDADFDQGDDQKLGLPAEDLDESTRSALGLKK